jgi:hypothetical protein
MKAVYHANRSLQARYEEIVEVVRENPGISKGALGKLLYPAAGTCGERNLGSLLAQLCFDGRIKYQDVHRYTAI